LIVEEYQARHCWGDRPGHAEYAARFPGQTNLPAALTRIDAQRAVEVNGPREGEPLLRAAITPTLSPPPPALPQAKLVEPLETVGACIGPYTLLERLGEGGAGEVYRARHQKMSRIAAVKVIRAELLRDDDMIRRFYREIEAVSQLKHENI